MKKILLTSIFFLMMFMVTCPVYGATVYSQSASKENPRGSWHDVEKEDGEIAIQIHIEDAGYYEFSPMSKDFGNYVIYLYNAKLDTRDDSKLVDTLKRPFLLSPIYCQADSYMTFLYAPDPEYIPGSIFIATEYIGETYEEEEDADYPWRVCDTHVYKEMDKNPATFTQDGSKGVFCTSCFSEDYITIAKVSNVTLSKKSYVYNGKSQKPKITVKDCLGKTLKSSQDYHLTYDKDTKSIGSHTVKITLTGNYSGSKTYTYKIVPKANSITSIRSLKKGFKVAWSKTSNITGYQIRYAANSKMTKAKTVNVSSKNLAKTISGLSRGKRYYVQVRTYKTVKKKMYPSAWSKIKSVKTK